MPHQIITEHGKSIAEFINRLQRSHFFLKHDTVRRFNTDEMPDVVDSCIDVQYSDEYIKKLIKARKGNANIFTQYTNKVARVYSQEPTFRTNEQSEKDLEIYEDWREDSDMNIRMQKMNRVLVENRTSLLKLFYDADDKKLQTTTITPDMYALLSSPSSKSKYIHDTVVISMGVERRGEDVWNVYGVYTDQEVAIIKIKKDDGDILTFEIFRNEFGSVGVDKGVSINPYGVMPFVNVRHFQDEKLNVMPDVEAMQTSIRVSIESGDLSVALYFQAAATPYGINIMPVSDNKTGGNNNNQSKNPYNFMMFDAVKPDATTAIGTLAPQVKANEVMLSMRDTVSSFLESRGIKISSNNVLNAEAVQSGISQIISNSDALAVIDSYKILFASFEQNVFDLWKIMWNFHAEANSLVDSRKVSEDFEITIQFAANEVAFIKESEIDYQTKLLNERLTTKRRSLQALNPDMSSIEIDKLIVEIEEESKENIERARLELPPGSNVQAGGTGDVNVNANVGEQ